MTTETNMNKKHQNAYKNKRTNRMLARKNAGVFARKQHHALSNKAIKKRERHDKHVLAGVLYAPAAPSAPTSAMQTEAVFAAAGHALAAKTKKSAGSAMQQ